MITIFTDGSSRGNPGPGGWGSIVVTDTKVIELGGGEKNTTNNKMELTAVIQGLRKASEACGKVRQGAASFGSMRNDAEAKQIKVYTDSAYVINGITKWIHGWKRNGWKTKTKDDVMNKDLWMLVDAALNVVGSGNVTWEYVGGHVGIAGNERCDIIATSFADGENIELYSGLPSDYSIKNILDVSHDKVLAKAKKSSSSRSKAQAYSYISAIGGKVQVHHSWADCEKRVKGMKGARYKKALNATEEKEIVTEFSK